MGKKDRPEGMDAGGKVGGRPGREHPNGWGAERRDLKKAGGDSASEVFGWGADGVEGTRKVK